MNTTRMIVDVREPFEYQADHVEGAINIPPMELMSGPSALKDVDKDSEIVLYCKTGSRSNVAIQLLQQMGFTNLVNGISAGHVRKKYPHE